MHLQPRPYYTRSAPQSPRINLLSCARTSTRRTPLRSRVATSLSMDTPHASKEAGARDVSDPASNFSGEDQRVAFTYSCPSAPDVLPTLPAPELQHRLMSLPPPSQDDVLASASQAHCVDPHSIRQAPMTSPNNADYDESHTTLIQLLKAVADFQEIEEAAPGRQDTPHGTRDSQRLVAHDRVLVQCRCAFSLLPKQHSRDALSEPSILASHCLMG